MPTLLRIGPADRGREISLDEFTAADFEAGYQYELVDGKLYASPQAEPPQSIVEEWVGGELLVYSRNHLNIMNLPVRAHHDLRGGGRKWRSSKSRLVPLLPGFKLVVDPRA